MSDRVYIVYLDVFFMINFLMDYMIILITSKIAKIKKKRIRKLAGAGFGALYSVIVIKPLTNHLFKITLVNILVAAVMVLISFGFMSASVYIKNVLLLFVVSFTMSGIINYLYYSTIIGKYVRNVHAKDGLYPTNGHDLGIETKLGDGKVDFKALFQKLYELGYNSHVTIEREIDGEQQTKDILFAREYLQNIVNEVYGKEA